MNKQQHDEYVNLVKDNIKLKYKRYYEILGNNGICKASNKLAQKIEVEEKLLQELNNKKFS